jgi:hypothetical protein
MRVATKDKFRQPLIPWFRTPGAPGIDLAPAKAPKRYPVVITIPGGAVNTLDVCGSNEQLIDHAVTQDSSVFKCELPLGVYEAIPHPEPPGKNRAWTFKVTEGGANESFG